MTSALTPSIDIGPLSALAQSHVQAILTHAFEYETGQAALLVFDTQSELAQIVSAAYRACLPQAVCLNFDSTPAPDVLAQIELLAPGSLVVLVQSTNFRLGAYRIRVELFKRGLKVIEHPHLARMPGAQMAHYIASLAYDPVYYRGVGAALKQRIDQASGGVVDSGGAQLVFGTRFEPAKLNVGDYRQMPNKGGQFPIGEVFTESQDLAAVNGKVRVFVFGDTSFLVNRPAQPITLVVEQGQVVTALDSTPEFDAVLNKIRADEGVVWVRELGFGMNRAFSKDCMVSDIGTYERMCGVHLSLGAKHGSYGKPHIKRGEGKYHIDVFAQTESVTLDGEVVYRDGAWCVG
jgi:aminopeptidase